ncbi:hypothetical protein GF402_10830 [Candidatus Fermentibacteria bacterium]|nr:hypothetical protein [Candidatus Fermentibacteria bacterium]
MVIWFLVWSMLFCTADDPHPAPPAFGLAVDGVPLPANRVCFVVMPGDSVTLRAVPDTSGRSDSLEWSVSAGNPRRGFGELMGWRAPRGHGIFDLRLTDGRRLEEYSIVVPVESCRWRTTTLNSFPVGSYGDGSTREHNPDFFIELRSEDLERRLTTHLTMGHFLCHTEGSFPQYMVLQMSLLDKLEAVLAEVQSEYPEPLCIVSISGFRTPSYNARIGNRTSFSQHLYGGAADVWFDGYPPNDLIEDLDRNKRVDVSDGELVVDAARKVEARGEAAVGGASAYRWTNTHGPFVHIDVRGSRATWQTRRNLIPDPVI